MSQNQSERLIEALLFASSEPLSVKALHERVPEGTDVGGALMSLQKVYEGRGVELKEVDGHWVFRTAQDLAGIFHVEKDVQKKLSRAAMETLAIIAYHQPVTRAEIENIRGVATNKGTIDVLLETGWIKPGRRRESPGRPLTWLTTPDFLDHFAISSLKDLPGMDDLRNSGLLDNRPAIEMMGASNDLFDEADEKDYEEEDEENSDADIGDDIIEEKQEANAS